MRRTPLARYVTDMMFVTSCRFEVVSTPMSNSHNFCPFPWIDLLNEIQTSIFFRFYNC